MSVLAAKLGAETGYDTFRVRQDRESISDFDREVQRVLGAGQGETSEEGDDS